MQGGLLGQIPGEKGDAHRKTEVGTWLVAMCWLVSLPYVRASGEVGAARGAIWSPPSGVGGESYKEARAQPQWQQLLALPQCVQPLPQTVTEMKVSALS